MKQGGIRTILWGLAFYSLAHQLCLAFYDICNRSPNRLLYLVIWLVRRHNYKMQGRITTNIKFVEEENVKPEESSSSN